jgi:hypothetical protein
MILKEEPLNVETSANLKPSGFAIKASKKAFEILSAGLYSDKVKAIVRELSTNAFDSHVAAGKRDVPFTVHLPNSFEPFFSVRDEGTGLSEHDITTLYTTYFESNKSSSNEFTGCLGLGSKSPFSYTDQFTVESRFNGKKYTYNAFKDQQGLPSIVKLSECDTDEPNGMEIKFPVKNADFYDFCHKASDVLRWFAVKPKVVGNPNFSFDKEEYLRQTNTYALSKSRVYHSNVVMGNVAYAVDPYEIKNTKVVLTPIERKVIEWGIDLYVPIGSVDITANREKISYDDASVLVIKNLLAEAIKDIQDEIEKQISTAPTLWAARRALHDARHSIIGQVKDLMTVKWNGKDLLDHVTNKMFLKEVAPGEAVAVPVIQSLDRKQTNFKKHFCDSIHADGRPIIVNDLGHGGYARAVAYLNSKGCDHGYLVSAEDYWLVATGIKEVAVLTSTLPKPQRANNYVPRRAGVKAKVNELVTSGSHRQCADYWKAAEIDLEDGGVYVEIVYYRYKRNGDGTDTRHPADLQQVNEYLKALGEETPIYGIRTSDLESIKKHEGWVSLDEYLKDVLQERLEEFNDNLLAWNDWYQCSSHWSNFSRMAGQKFLKGSKFGEFFARLQKAATANSDNKTRTYVSLAKEAAFKLPESESNLDAMRVEVFKQYPLLAHINWYSAGSASGQEAVMNYINAIDASLGCEGEAVITPILRNEEDEDMEDAA